jgi:hypothetical protein
MMADEAVSDLWSSGGLAPDRPTAATAFDFIAGDWMVNHRKLKAHLAGSDEWMECDGETKGRILLGGFGNIDENLLHQPGGTYRAITLRLFDRSSSIWSIWWVTDLAGTLEAPVLGGFDRGIGTFFGDEMLDGRPIRVRFIWSDITDSSARWEQAFSADGGATWETNWIMIFRRRG